MSLSKGGNKKKLNLVFAYFGFLATVQSLEMCDFQWCLPICIARRQGALIQKIIAARGYKLNG